MENAQSPFKKNATTYGVLLGIIMVFIAVIMYVTGMPLEGKQWPQYLYYLIFPAGIIIAIKNFKIQSKGFLSLSEALKLGLAIAVISALIFVIYSLVFNYIIDPTYNEAIIEIALDKVKESPNVTDEQIAQTTKFMKFMANPALGGAVWLALSLFFGLIYSLIGGLVMKRDNPYEDA